MVRDRDGISNLEAQFYDDLFWLTFNCGPDPDEVEDEEDEDDDDDEDDGLSFIIALCNALSPPDVAPEPEPVAETETWRDRPPLL